MFAMAVVAVTCGALYAGLAFGFNTIKFARENTRATQILVERMETARLYTWSQVNSNGFIPTNRFTVPYYALGGTNTSLMYTGQVFISDSGLTNSYAGDLKKITIQVNWVTGKTPRVRTMSTYVAKFGMQTYVF
jgi:hypothetical protein